MIRIYAIISTIALGLMGCGSDINPTLAKIPGLEILNEEPVGLSATTLPIIDQVGNDGRRAINVIRVERKAGLDMIEIARKSNRSTYMSASRRGLVLNNGIITQTQGIGGDLSSSTHASYDLGYRDRVFTKTHGYLGGDDQIETVAFRCVRTARPTDYFGLNKNRRLLTPVDEICSNESQSHENLYFLYPGTTTVFRSRQWVSDAIGYLRVEQIKIPTR